MVKSNHKKASYVLRIVIISRHVLQNWQHVMLCNLKVLFFFLTFWINLNKSHFPSTLCRIHSEIGHRISYQCTVCDIWNFSPTDDVCSIYYWCETGLFKRSGSLTEDVFVSVLRNFKPIVLVPVHNLHMGIPSTVTWNVMFIFQKVLFAYSGFSLCFL